MRRKKLEDILDKFANFFDEFRCVAKNWKISWINLPISLTNFDASQKTGKSEYENLSIWRKSEQRKNEGEDLAEKKIISNSNQANTFANAI